MAVGEGSRSQAGAAGELHEVATRLIPLGAAASIGAP